MGANATVCELRPELRTEQTADFLVKYSGPKTFLANFQLPMDWMLSALVLQFVWRPPACRGAVINCGCERVSLVMHRRRQRTDGPRENNTGAKCLLLAVQWRRSCVGLLGQLGERESGRRARLVLGRAAAAAE